MRVVRTAEVDIMDFLKGLFVYFESS